VKRNLHITAQIVALAAQSLIPSLPFSVALRAWIVPIIAFVQGALALIALYSEPPTGGNSPGSNPPPPSGAATAAVLVFACGALSQFVGVWA
jgi:hypothetical protein